MIALHSLWTGTYFWKMTRGTALIHTLSLCLAKKVFPEVRFVTDSQGSWIAGALGWRYDEIVDKLTNLAPESLKHIWAMGKIHAISLQTEPFCHLDNDVLLFKRLPDRILNARIFAQSKDSFVFYGSKKMKRAIEVCGLGGMSLPFNTGIIGGTDFELLHQYGARAVGACRHFAKSDIDGTTISMAVEQSWLGSFAHKKGVRIEELLPPNFTDADAEALNYCHLIGKSKHRPEIQARCEARLSRDFSDEYRALNKGWLSLVEAGYLDVAA